MIGSLRVAVQVLRYNNLSDDTEIQRIAWARPGSWYTGFMSLLKRHVDFSTTSTSPDVSHHSQLLSCSPQSFNGCAFRTIPVSSGRQPAHIAIWLETQDVARTSTAIRKWNETVKHTLQTGLTRTGPLIGLYACSAPFLRVNTSYQTWLSHLLWFSS